MGLGLNAGKELSHHDHELPRGAQARQVAREVRHTDLQVLAAYPLSKEISNDSHDKYAEV